MLLSIIIPTKNRYSTLFSVVDMILSFNLNDEIEIVIQDNSDNNAEALEFVSQRNKYKNLRYFYCSENLSQTGNSDKAVYNSTGEFVCFIGDDDGVMPNIVEVTKWMKEHDFKALRSYKPNYYWPDQKSNFLSSDISGVLRYQPWKDNNFHIIKTQKALDDTLKHGGVSMKLLPCVYHGIVERKMLDLIYNKTGSFFPGPSPDMANAIALTQVIDRYVQVDYPVIISGKSVNSIGGAGVLHQHVSKIEDVAHLPKDTAKYWEPRIPKYWTGPTIWAESVLKALKVFENENAIKRFNYDYLYAYLMVFHKKQAEQIFNNFELEENKLSLLKLNIFLYRVKMFLKNRMGAVKKVSNVKDMGAAVALLSKLKT